MDQYDKFMRQLVDYLDGTWLSKRTRPPLPDLGPIKGSSDAEIEQAEAQIGKSLPASLKAWYRVAGKVPPYVYDYDADFSVQDLIAAQTTARKLSQAVHSQWELTESLVPFSQRIGEQFLMVDVSKGCSDDPPVFHFLEGKAFPMQSSVAFSAFMREEWLGWLERRHWGERNKLWMEGWRTKSKDEWLARKHVLDALESEAHQFRISLVEQVYQEDLERHEITGPREFQERWVAEFFAGEIWKKYQSEGLSYPYNWITPAQGE